MVKVRKLGGPRDYTSVFMNRGDHIRCNPVPPGPDKSVFLPAIGVCLFYAKGVSVEQGGIAHSAQGFVFQTHKELLDVSLGPADGRIGDYHARRPCSTSLLDIPWSVCTFVGSNVCEWEARASR
jgi:hypothetical protein